jgi:hypothetical protein
VLVSVEVWKVSVITGVYEPEEEGGQEEEAEDQDENNDEGQDEDGENENNNADGQVDSYEARKGAKYKVAPKPPTCGLVVALYGDRGKTAVLPLESSAPDGTSSFLPGSADEFKVSTSFADNLFYSGLRMH